jgi:hypothetical protein
MSAGGGRAHWAPTDCAQSFRALRLFRPPAGVRQLIFKEITDACGGREGPLGLRPTVHSPSEPYGSSVPPQVSDIRPPATRWGSWYAV